jgi:hypothetical protein
MGDGHTGAVGVPVVLVVEGRVLRARELLIEDFFEFDHCGGRSGFGRRFERLV